ncbi:MAG: SRPBCC domain-containing protein [Bacteroidota bacterium]
MKKQEHKIIIDASPEKVWNTIIGKETYPMWTALFAEGSMVETDWKEGSKAVFGDGKGSGMLAIIETNVPNQFLSIRHIGEVVNGVEDTESERVKSWAGAHENYTLTKVEGKTEWLVEIDVNPEWEEYFAEAWPKAMDKVKEIAEQK